MIRIFRTPALTSRRPLSPTLVMAFALVWAQMLGLAHRVLHAPPPAAAANSSYAAAAGHKPDPGVLAHLLAPAQAESDCRLYDQLGLADTLPALPVLGLPVAAPAAALATARLALAQPVCAPFEARAPPAIR